MMVDSSVSHGSLGCLVEMGQGAQLFLCSQFVSNPSTTCKAACNMPQSACKRVCTLFPGVLLSLFVSLSAQFCSGAVQLLFPWKQPLSMISGVNSKLFVLCHVVLGIWMWVLLQSSLVLSTFKNASVFAGTCRNWRDGTFIVLLRWLWTLCVWEPFWKEPNEHGPIIWVPDERVPNWEPFLKLETFSKKVHKVCLKTSVVANKFGNRLLWTLLFVVSLSTKGS